MDRLRVIGTVLALVALIGGSVLKGAGLSGLWSPAAFVIVIVGTLAAILLQTSLPTFMRAMKMVAWVFRPPAHDQAAVIAQIVEWSTTARKQGLLGLEAQVAQQSDPFLGKGLQMVVDGVEPESIRQMLEIELHGQSARDLAAAKVFEGMGIYAPTRTSPIRRSSARASPRRSPPPSTASARPTWRCCRSATSSRTWSTRRRWSAR